MGDTNKGKKHKKEKKGASSSNNSDAVGTSSSNAKSQATTLPLSVGQELIRQSFLSCSREFYTLPEMIEFMTTKYPSVTAEMVVKVFRLMLKRVKAEEYLRASHYYSRLRLLQQRMERDASASLSTAPPESTSTAPCQSDGASSSS